LPRIDGFVHARILRAFRLASKMRANTLGQYESAQRVAR
jgi:hypothetical protein